MPGLGDEGSEEGEVCAARRPPDEAKDQQEVDCNIKDMGSHVAVPACFVGQSRQGTFCHLGISASVPRQILL